MSHLCNFRILEAVQRSGTTALLLHASSRANNSSICCPELDLSWGTDVQYCTVPFSSIIIENWKTHIDDHRCVVPLKGPAT